MHQQIKAAAAAYGEQVRAEALELLRTLGRIPAPSHQEDRRAAFCRDWLLEQGAEDVVIDAAKNVVCRIDCQEDRDLVVFAAHTDIVFPDTDPLPLREEDGRIREQRLRDMEAYADYRNYLSFSMYEQVTDENGTVIRET